MRLRFRINRIRFLRIGALILFLIVFGRVSWLQAVASEDLSRKAVASRTTDRRIEPKRGNIYDATGKVLAASMVTKTVFAEPQNYQATAQKLKADPEKAKLLDAKLKNLADILQLPLPEIQAKLESLSTWVSLAKQVELDKAEQIKKLQLAGIGFIEDSKRVYPMGSTAAAVLGVVNLDGKGAEGLELSYNSLLYGEKGFISEETDARDRSLPGGVHTYDPPRDGNNLVLTLDSNIQHFVEQQLDDIMANTQPKSAIIIAMDPKSGKILAMGNRPSFDPNDYRKFPEPSRRNLAVTSQYEPGSTFKVITAAAALEEGTTAPNKVYRDPGFLVVDKQRITNWDSGNSAPGAITFTEGMEQSSNVVLGQVGLELSREMFFKYMRGFGFGQPTAVDLPGEASGTLLPEQRTSRFEQATMSFGQANAVTPLQLLTAINAVANGGTLLRPYVVQKAVDSEGNLLRDFTPGPGRNILSRGTTDQLRAILEQVVDKGTGQLAKIPGYRVAGKTGTAQKVEPGGKYSEKEFVSSFVGYAPADDPRISVLVIVDSPHKGGYHGGEVAAPRFQAIVQQALTYLNVPPTSGAGSGGPDLQSKTDKAGPKPVIPERKPNQGEGVMPDLSGRTMSEAGELLSKQGFRMNFSGSGLAVSQQYPPGKVLATGTVVNVRFEQ